MPNVHFLQLQSTCALPNHKICFLSFTRISISYVPARFARGLKCGGWSWGHRQQSRVKSNIEFGFNGKLLVPSTHLMFWDKKLEGWFSRVGDCCEAACARVTDNADVSKSMEKYGHSIDAYSEVTWKKVGGSKQVQILLENPLLPTYFMFVVVTGFTQKCQNLHNEMENPQGAPALGSLAFKLLEGTKLLHKQWYSFCFLLCFRRNRCSWDGM